eukprot:COSAG02_NODE_803_length_17021_cov_18.597270_7_plen_68_part_00
MAGIRALVPGADSDAESTTSDGDASSSIDSAAAGTNAEESTADDVEAPDSAAQLAENSGNVNVEDVR